MVVVFDCPIPMPQPSAQAPAGIHTRIHTHIHTYTHGDRQTQIFQSAQAPASTMVEFRVQGSGFRFRFRV